MYKFNKRNKVFLIIIITIVFAVLTYYIYTNAENGEIISYDSETKDKDIKETEESKEIEKDKLIEKTIVVHVAGEVKKPGIVELKENSRVSDAIEKAGGLLEDANLNKINLAYVLEDGMKIYIPANNDNEEVEYMTDNSGVDTLERTDTKSGNQKININTANISELETLPGIGEATAQKIINYREEKGEFSSIEEIQDVKGIGNSKFENIKDLIYVK